MTDSRRTTLLKIMNPIIDIMIRQQMISFADHWREYMNGETLQAIAEKEELEPHTMRNRINGLSDKLRQLIQDYCNLDPAFEKLGYSMVRPLELLHELERLQEENTLLKHTLEHNGITVPTHTASPDVDDDILDLKLVDLKLSERALNQLTNAGITTLRHLTEKTKNDIYKIRNFGKRSMTEVENLMENYKISFQR